MTDDLLMGVDFGTESARVGFFTPDGTAVSMGTATYELRHPRPGWAEQDPDEWWSSLVSATRDAIDERDIDPDRVVGLSVDATSATLVAMGSDDRHLRPAIMWMDVRASAQAERIAQTGHDALKYNGYGPVSAEWGLPKAMWLQSEEPDTFDAARRLVDCGDWLVHRLTGTWAFSTNMAAAKYYHDRDTGGFPTGLYEQVDAGAVLDKFPADVVDPGTHIGDLTADAAEQLGLRAGTPVSQGCVDAYAGALGLGVVEPGTMALITGSSHVMIGQSAEPVHGRGFWGAYTDAILPGQYTVEAGQASTGSVIAWFKNRFAADAVNEAERRGVDAYDVLNEQAAELPIGSDGLIAIDWFQGNRTPHVDPLVRGMFWGLSLSHTPAHLYRAIMEGICYGTEHIFASMGNQGFRPERTIAAGGATRSALWTQMHADVSNTPIAAAEGGDNAPVLGAAMLAAVGAGIHDDLATAADRMVRLGDEVEPDADAHEAYRFYYDRYTETYDQMKDLMHATVRHESDHGSATD